MATAPGRARPKLPIGPLLLIAIGGLLLLNSLGLISWEIWRTLVRLWPLVLVLLGLQALITGRIDWASLVVLLGAFALLALATQLVFPRVGTATPPVPTAEHVRYELQGAQRAVVRLEFGGGELQVGSHDEPGVLAVGGLVAGRGLRLSSEYRVRDGVGTLELRQRGEREAWMPFLHGDGHGADRLQLDLARGVPLELRVEAGAADGILDLRDLTVSVLRFNSGAARSTVVMPAEGTTRAELQAGAASLSIQIPDGVAAHIQTGSSGLSKLDVDTTRFPPTGGAYESPNYASAANRLDLTINAGASNVVVR